MSSPAATHDVFAQENHNAEEREQEEQDEDVEGEELNAEEEEEKQEQEHFDNLAELRENFFIKHGNKNITFPTTKTTWKPGKIFSERMIDQMHTIEVSAMCVAVQVEGPNCGLKAMLRIRKQLPAHYSSRDFPIETFSVLSPEATQEIDGLRDLMEKGCTSTPRFIDYLLKRQSDEDIFPGGFILYIVMEKVPGFNLRNFETFSLDERDQVRIAFAKAFYEFLTMGYFHDDHYPRNLIWDRRNKKGYIIDLESARKSSGSFEPMFSNYKFRQWSLAGLDDQIDPMVVEHANWFYQNNKSFPTDEEWATILANSKGKPSISERRFSNHVSFLEKEQKKITK
ncbi:hypothetical protein BDFG_08192 [Blastomyces dermatitidis ATCC 26199]|nr:hypothetical protein BDFG_08192 [Blastomyces dermatitidis ATCC 26199]